MEKGQNIGKKSSQSKFSWDIVLLKECPAGSLSFDMVDRDFIIYHVETGVTTRFASFRVADEFFEVEVNK